MKDKILAFLKETLAEMRKVTWPDRRYVGAATVVVLALVVLSALFLMFTDYVFAAVFKVILR